MTPERWRKVEEVFHVAADMAGDERAAFLEGACGGDPEVRQEVERLLRLDAEAGNFIESPAPFSHLTQLVYTSPLDRTDVEQTGAMSGRQVGAYQLLREIGRGGMGTVYLAERADNEFRRQVAIKLIKRGMDTDFIVRRFRNERQILASLDHPNIARLLDGGTTDDGLPYFVMEYIEGLPISRYSDGRRLPLADRLRLFQQVCAAVHYAHQNFVIHRDIKPGNILVTPNGTPKLLDFGIAKILNPDILAHDTNDPTATAMRLMTPMYASPEQARGERVTPASDQYSLGVLLYELLTGHRPYRLKNQLPHEISRIICEQQPERPSRVVEKTEEVTSPDGSERVVLDPELISRYRSTSLAALREELASGLDDIVLQTLSKDPAHRYPSIAELSEDIGRFLDGREVRASLLAARHEDGFGSFDTDEPLPAQNSLAILPFRLLQTASDDDTESGFLGVGLADALITRLSNVRTLTVRPTASVTRYARGDYDALEAGKRLNVTYVLDGRMLKAGGRLRVTVQLIDVRTESPLWAAQFDESHADILDLHDSISRQVAEAVVPQLTGEERARLARRGTDNPQAYEAYLRGRYYWHTYTEEGLAKALLCAYEAIALDPDFGLAYSCIADYHNWQGISAAMPPSESFLAAKEAAMRAIQLDGESAEGYASLAFTAWAYDWDVAEGERLYRRALTLNPNYAQAHEWYGHLLNSQGRHEEAVREMRRAERLDPQSPSTAAMFGYCLFHARRYPEAAVKFQRSLDLEADYYFAWQGLGWVYLMAGKHQLALEALARAVAASGGAPVTLWSSAHALAVAGEAAAAREKLRTLEELAERRYVPAYYFAMIHAALGETEAAFAGLESAFAARDYWVLWLSVEPRFDAIRNDARFQSLLRRLMPAAGARRTGAETVAMMDETAAGGTSPDLLPPAAALTSGTAATREVPATASLDTREMESPGLRAPTRSRLRTLALSAALLLPVLAGIFFLNWSSWFPSAPALSRGKNPAQLTSHAANDSYPQVSPDGGRIAFSSNRDGKAELYVMSADGSREARRLTFNSVEDTAPDWSPDGRKLAFDQVRSLGEESDICVIDADGANLVNLTNTPGYDTRAAWSPDGSKIAFASNRGGADWAAFDIYVMNADGSNPVRLTDDPGFEDDPFWSPDGSKIAFTGSTEAGKAEIFVINADGTGRVNLTNHPGADNRPAWSPDGRWIAFDSSRDTNSVSLRAIYVMPADGSAPRRITGYDALNAKPAWTPDSKRLVFYSNRTGNEEIFITDVDGDTEAARSALPDGGERKSIVVLPFRTAGPGEEEEGEEERSLGVGLADVLTSRLGQIRQLSVRAASAGRRFGNRNATAQEIGRELGTDYILRGTITNSASGERQDLVQVQAELVTASDERIVWAEKFDQGFTDVAVLQGAIAERVARALTLELTSSEQSRIEKRHTENSEAYQLYLVGRYHLARRSVAGINAAAGYFNQAIKKDSDFALAYAGVADCYLLLKLYGSPPPKDAYAKARENALKALALDESLAEARAPLAYVKFYADRDRAGAEQDFRRAIELNPSYTTARHWLAIALSAMGRHEEAVAEIGRAKQLDPRSAILYTASGMLLYYARRYEEGAAECRRALELDAGLVPAHKVLRWIYQATGRYNEALAAYRQEKSYSGAENEEWPVILAQVQALGDRGLAEATLRRGISEAVARRETDFLVYEIATAYAILGNRDEALTWLARAERINEHGFHFVAVDPDFDAVREDARFAALMKKDKKR